MDSLQQLPLHSNSSLPMAEDETEINRSEDARLFVSTTSAAYGMEVDAPEAEKEDEADADDDDSEEEGDFALTFQGDMNPFDFTENDASGVQPFEKFERLEYESLAERKRKALMDHPAADGLFDKEKSGDQLFGASIDEIMEAMNYGGNRRKRRKQKKRGRPKGSRNKASPEVSKMLGEGTLHYANGRYAEAISLLTEVVRIAPNLPDTYHTLGLVYDAVGDKQKAMSFYMLTAVMRPKDSSLWKLLLSWSLEQGNIPQARYCLSKATMADPEDVTLRFHFAQLYIELGDNEKAAKTYEQIAQLCADNVEAHKRAADLYKSCRQVERAVSILEEYLKKNQLEADLSVVDMLAAISMESGEYERALERIEGARSVYCSGKDLPLCLTAKAGICHVHLGNMDKAKVLFGIFSSEIAHVDTDLIIEIADSLKSLEHYRAALNYYLTLENNSGHDHGNLFLKIAQCYLSLRENEKAIEFFYKALGSLEDSVDARLSLASLLLEKGEDDKAILLLSPANGQLTLDANIDQSNMWWLNEKVKLKLANIYRAKMMRKEFVDLIYPLIHQSLTAQPANKEVRLKKRLSTSVLIERAKVLEDHQSDNNVFQGFRPTATASELLKANRAKRKLKEREEMKAKAMAAGLDWQSDDSDEDPHRQRLKKLPIPLLLKDEEHHQLVVDLCISLASLQRYKEALDVTKLTLKFASDIMSSENKDKLMTLGVQMACNVIPNNGYEFVRDIVRQRPHSMAAWNCYYKVVSRMNINHSRHSRFLHKLRDKDKDCVPPLIITGHQFTEISQHQAAAREYLQAYKLCPDNPLVNLCVGTALINLAFDTRLHNKHLCMAQGFAFLYNNLRLCRDTQEALYNIARAYHHVGLVSLAASYYEKVLATRQNDCPLPKLCYENHDLTRNQKPVYCNLCREAAYNLHLIYKKSGAVDLARQVLRDHCSL